MIATTHEQIGGLKEAGRRLARILEALQAAAKSDVTTKELDALAEKLIREGGDVPAFLGYQPHGASYPYPATLCISVNEEVVHGLPGERILQEGDIVGLDLGLVHEGFIVDAARTVAVGATSPDAVRLMERTAEALRRGVEKAKRGGRIGDISAAIEKVARDNNLGIVRELGGHGVGEKVHEPPFIPNFGVAGKGPFIEEGMVLAIEPMFTLGGGDVEVAADDYTFKTSDGSLSAHFEDTVLVTAEGPLILTRA